MQKVGYMGDVIVEKLIGKDEVTQEIVWTCY